MPIIFADISYKLSHLVYGTPQPDTVPIVYTVSQKTQDTKLLPITSPNVNWFSEFFHC